MKIRAVTIAAAFACGIVLRQSVLVLSHATHRSFLEILLALACGLVCLALLLSWRNLHWAGASASLLCSAVLAC